MSPLPSDQNQHHYSESGSCFRLHAWEEGKGADIHECRWATRCSSFLLLLFYYFFPVPFPEGWLQPIVCLHLTLLCFSHTKWLHVPFHSNHKSSLCSSSRPPACQFQLQHSSPAMCVYIISVRALIRVIYIFLCLTFRAQGHVLPCQRSLGM